ISSILKETHKKGTDSLQHQFNYTALKILQGPPRQRFSAMNITYLLIVKRLSQNKRCLVSQIGQLVSANPELNH
ncbi:MAG: hypothetical protein AAGU27_01080, partial [Dehalobacterium sp.]